MHVFHCKLCKHYGEPVTGVCISCIGAQVSEEDFGGKYAPRVYKCVVCGEVDVDAEGGFDTCPECVKKI